MQKKSFSMVKFLLAVYTSITLFLLAILSFFVFYSLHTVKEQFTAAQQQTLNLYLTELDQSLEKISSSLRQYQLQEGVPDFSSLDSSALYRKKSEIVSDFSTHILFLDPCDGLFLYSPETDDYLYAFHASSQETYNTRLSIKDAAARIMQASGLSTSAGWYLEELEGRQYLLYLQWLDGVCYGSWSNAASLLPAVSELSSYSDTFLYLTDETGNVLAAASENSQTSQRAITVNASSAVTPVTLFLRTPETHALSTMSFSLRLLLGASIFALLTIVIAYIALNRVVKRPLEQVLGNISEYESGNLDFVPDDHGMPLEILRINQALASMSQEIKALKIDIYEKQLSLKDTQLQYLAHQIKPHFVINILNTVSLMVQMKEEKKTIAILQYLSAYMRNRMNLNIRSIPLSQEMEQLETYLHLQEIRYPDQFRVRTAIEPELESFLIPVLTIQTLVENIFKHAMEPYQPLVITISATVSENHVILTVKDNGCGFPEELRKTFNGQPEAPGDGQHIGLVNIRQRLNLEYPKQAKMELQNDSGAVVIITLPWAE
ncbi:MAG: histidine kinase [Eubacteriales bacterium]|nr:histidine kinase [Eubacteriales bacterium]